MMCGEDFLDDNNRTKEVGGLSGLISRSKNNLNIIKNWVSVSNWADFLCEDVNNLSSTSICLKLTDPKIIDLPIEIKNNIEKNIIKLLEQHKVAFDIGSYRSAPPGLRIWGGPTVESDDVANLLPWLDWAYYQTLDQLKLK